MIKITIEGPQGSGKTTAAAEISKVLRDKGVDHSIVEKQTDGRQASEVKPTMRQT